LTNLFGFLARGELDKRKAREKKGVDAFDDPGELVVEGNGDFAFEGADDPCSDFGSGEDGVDEMSMVESTLCDCRWRRHGREQWR